MHIHTHPNLLNLDVWHTHIITHMQRRPLFSLVQFKSNNRVNATSKPLAPNFLSLLPCFAWQTQGECGPSCLFLPVIFFFCGPTLSSLRHASSTSLVYTAPTAQGASLFFSFFPKDEWSLVALLSVGGGRRIGTRNGEARKKIKTRFEALTQESKSFGAKVQQKNIQKKRQLKAAEVRLPWINWEAASFCFLVKMVPVPSLSILFLASRAWRIENEWSHFGHMTWYPILAKPLAIRRREKGRRPNGRRWSGRSPEGQTGVEGKPNRREEVWIIWP